MRVYLEDHIYSFYLATCPAGRQYVGATTKDVWHRWRTHWGNPPRPWPGPEKAILCDAIKHYGREAFVVEHIASARGTENAKATETALIKQYGSANGGYNQSWSSHLPAYIDYPGTRISGTPRDIIRVRNGACAWPPQQRAA